MLIRVQVGEAINRAQAGARSAAGRESTLDLRSPRAQHPMPRRAVRIHQDLPVVRTLGGLRIFREANMSSHQSLSSIDADRLDGDAANDHHLHDLDWIAHDLAVICLTHV
jgi:hypothetical protein